MTDPITTARALIEPLTGYTPGPWKATIYDDVGYINDPLSGYDGDFKPGDARLIAAAPDLRDMIATLADALEVERAKVAAAYEATATVQSGGFDMVNPATRDTIRTHTPADAETILDKLLADARLEGWRAGRDAAADEAALYSCTEGSDDYTIGVKEGYTEAVSQIVDAIRALPEPKETSHD